ncbi:MAG: response regulator [Magnetovibrionaceae bacterium]
MTGLRKESILIVDRRPEYIDRMARALKPLGSRVIASRTWEDALLDFKQHNYRLVVTGVFMSGMGGIEGIRQVKRLDDRVQVIAASEGWRDVSAEHALSAAMMVGADAVLPKPFDESDLTLLAEQCLEEAIQDFTPGLHGPARIGSASGAFYAT